MAQLLMNLLRRGANLDGIRLHALATARQTVLIIGTPQANLERIFHFYLQ
jgi:hypothetical protein